ncbi:MAG: shikimate kinase [Gammaproteobacteria bacterium]
MGAGKTAIGRELARALDRPFKDTDAEIERRTGVDVARIFDQEGEAGFRKRERRVVDELTLEANIVLATGGGVVVDPANRAALARRGTVIYLYATVAQQAERTRVSRTRPLLDNENPKERLQLLFDTRDALYREIADAVIPTDGRRVPTVVRQIIAELDAQTDD